MFNEILSVTNENKKIIRQILKCNEKGIVGYIRTASSDYGNISIKNQKDIITNFCKEFDIRCTDIYIDDGFSGLNFERVSIKSIIDSNKYNMIIVSNFSRIARDYNLMTDFIEKINKSIVGINECIVIKKNFKIS